MQVYARLIWKGWEAAKKVGGQTLGYAKFYDKDTDTDFSCGTTFAVDPKSIDSSPRDYVMDLTIREGKYGVQLTLNNIQVAGK